MTQISSIISNIRYWIVHVPLKDDISWASGKRTGSTRLICEITTDEGVKGYGETICLLDFVPTVFEKVIIPLGLQGLLLLKELHRALELMLLPLEPLIQNLFDLFTMLIQEIKY